MVVGVDKEIARIKEAPIWQGPEYFVAYQGGWQRINELLLIECLLYLSSELNSLYSCNTYEIRLFNTLQKVRKQSPSTLNLWSHSKEIIRFTLLFPSKRLIIER